MRVVFIFNEYSLHNAVITSYIAARPSDQVSLVKVPLVLKGKSRSETAKSVLPKMSRRFIGAKALEFVSLLGITFMPKLLRRGAVFRRLRLIARAHGLPYKKVGSIMAKESLEFIRAQKPDLIVTLFHQIIKEPLISIPRLGIINIHPGLLPDFRGIQPYFWQLSEGHGRSGVTLHFIEDEGIDTGRVLAQASYPTTHRMSVQLNYFLTALTAAHVLPTCVGLLEAGGLAPKRQDASVGAYYKWPDRAAVDRLAKRGHPLISPTDLWAILSGSYDSFVPDDERYSLDVIGPT